MGHSEDGFDMNEYTYDTQPNEWLKSIFNVKGRFKVGLLTAGEGNNAVYMAKLGHDVTVYDLSQKDIDKTQKLAQIEGVEVSTELQDIAQPDALPKAEYDVSINVFGHVPASGKAEMVRNLAESVKAGGSIVFELYSRRQIEFQTGAPKDIHMMFDAGDLRREFEEHGAEVIELREVIIRRGKGRMRQRKSAVIQGYLKKR